MKKIVLLLLAGCLCFGCAKKGDNGKDGVNGTNGTNGTNGRDATAKTYFGNITSDTVVVSIPELESGSLPIVSVYCSDSAGAEWIEIPVYNASNGGNVVASIFYGKIEIYYAYSNGFRRYYIVIAAYPHATLLNRLL